VRFADAHVEEAFRELVAHRLQHVALAHGGRDHHDARVLAHPGEDGVAGDVGIAGGASPCQRNGRPVFPGKRGGGVVGDRVLDGGLEPVPFFGHHVQEDRALEVADHRQVLLQLAEVVPVDRADVAEPEILEEHPAQHARLDAVLDLVQEPLHGITHHRHPLEHLLHFGLQAGVGGGHSEPIEGLGQPAHARADRHLVVVQHDGDVLLQPAGVVHRLEHDPGGECPVADHRDRVPVFLRDDQIVAALQPEGRGHATAGMSGHDQVVGAFSRVGIAHQPPLGPDGRKLAVAAGDHLVGIDLMAGVPDEAVSQEVEGGVQGERQLDHAQVRGEVGASSAQQPAEGLAHLAGQPLQLGKRERREVFGGPDCRKDAVH